MTGAAEPTLQETVKDSARFPSPQTEPNGTDEPPGKLRSTLACRLIWGTLQLI